MYKRESPRPFAFSSILAVLAAISLLLFCSPAFPGTSLNTLKTKIIFDSPTDLLEMERKLNFRAVDVGSPENLLPLGRPHNPTELQLAAKVEGILAKVSSVLKLNRTKRPPLTIRLLKDGHQVMKIFQFIQPSHMKPLLAYGSLEAFYEPGCRTIFLSLKDLHEGILAHEIAHFLLCTGKFAPPPEDYQEEVARYAESRIH